jgi:hypothetical protein
MKSQCTEYVEIGNKENFIDKQFNDTIKKFFKSRWKNGVLSTMYYMNYIGIVQLWSGMK